MKKEKVQNVSQALQKDRIDSLTKEALARGDASGLTANDVLQALKNEGIDDLNALANKILYKMRPSAEEDVRKAAMPIDYQLLLQPDPKELNPTITHRRPAKPFILDGVSHTPEEISRFDGRPLYFVSIGRSMDDQKLVVFKDKTLLMHYVMNQIVASQLEFTDFKGCIPDPTKPIYCYGVGSAPGYLYKYICGYECKTDTTPTPPPPPPPPRPPSPPSAQFFQHMNFAGNSFKMEPGLMYPDLTTLYRSGTRLFEDADWNDVISSIFLDQTTVMCWEHVGFHGSMLTLGLGQGGSDPVTAQGYLESLGWNDRISSIICWSKIG